MNVLLQKYLPPLFVIVALSYVLWYLQRVLPRKIRTRRLSHRQPLTTDELYSRFYADSPISKETVEEAVTFISSRLGVPAAQILLTDRLDGELGPVRQLEAINTDHDDLWEDLWS